MTFISAFAFSQLLVLPVCLLWGWWSGKQSAKLGVSAEGFDSKAFLVSLGTLEFISFALCYQGTLS